MCVIALCTRGALDTWSRGRSTAALAADRKCAVPRYYHLDSSGEDTNLQLYSLKQAMRFWKELDGDVQQYGEDIEQLKERCVFVLATLGLSISQLLGQNNPLPGRRVPYPLELFRSFVEHHDLPSELITRFERFNYFYNGCRHFGLTTTGRGYDSVNELSFAVARECYEFGLHVWAVVIEVFRNELGSDLDDFDMETIDVWG